MPDLNETRGILETAFMNGWGATTPVRFDNLAFSDDNLDAFVDVKMINYTSRNATIGCGFNKRKRHKGVLSLRVFVKQNIGAGQAYSYADQISTIMDNFSQGGMFTLASESTREGENEGGWYVVIVDIPYISDEV